MSKLNFRSGKKKVLRAVVDTNLIVSGTATTSTIPYRLLEAWREGEYILVTSVPIIEEVKDVLARPEKHFAITKREIKQVIKTLSTQAYVAAGTLELDVVKRDPDDNKFIAAALEGGASHIVSGDKDLLDIGQYQEIKFVTARDFLEKDLKLL